MRTILWFLGGVLSFAGALVLSGVGGCNVHELGHLVTGSALGVPVNDIFWCTPANGRIAFAYQEPAVVGYSGGFLAAIVLAGLYRALVRPRLSSFAWWMAGVAILGTAVSQVIVGVLEGSAPETYAGLQDNTGGLAVVLVAPLLAAGAVQLLVHKPRGPLAPT
jgi:hypothetical protein